MFMDTAISLNAETRVIASHIKSLSYEQIADMAGISVYRTPTVVWATHQEQGSLCKGESVKLRQGMIINCMVTGSA